LVLAAATGGLVTIAICLTPASAWSQSGAIDLGWRVIGGGGGASTAPGLRLEGTVGQPIAEVAGTPPYRLVAGFWAILASPACLLDVDGNGVAEAATDVVYVARHLLRLTPVPPSFRLADPTIPPDAAVAARVDAAGEALDVDQRGGVGPATDLVYIARHLLQLSPVPPGFRVADPTIPPDATIAGRIDGLCPQ
jgi:hypothetical protein